MTEFNKTLKLKILHQIHIIMYTVHGYHVRFGLKIRKANNKKTNNISFNHVMYKTCYRWN